MYACRYVCICMHTNTDTHTIKQVSTTLILKRSRSLGNLCKVPAKGEGKRGRARLNLQS